MLFAGAREGAKQMVIMVSGSITDQSRDEGVASDVNQLLKISDAVYPLTSKGVNIVSVCVGEKHKPGNVNAVLNKNVLRPKTYARLVEESFVQEAAYMTTGLFSMCFGHFLFLFDLCV